MTERLDPQDPERLDPRDPVLAALESLAAVEAATGVEALLRAAVEAACRITSSPRGIAGLCDDEAATASEWFHVGDGWIRLEQRWPLGVGVPGRVCASAMPLIRDDVTGRREDAAEGSAGEQGTAERSTRDHDAAASDAREHDAAEPSATDRGSASRPAHSACVPLGDVGGKPTGFLEVGDRENGYGADDLRRLKVIADRAAERLQALAGVERAEADQRLVMEALVGGRELSSLDPDGVLSEAAARARALTASADTVAVRLDGPGRPVVDRLDARERAALDEAVRTRAPATAGARVLVFPLLAAERAVGALVVRGAGVPLGGQRLEALAALAARAGAALDHAILCQNQADMAQRLQDRLLPLDPPEIPGLDIAVAYRSASHGAGRGGDFVDFYSRTDGHLALVIGDVAGKGVDAVATTLVVKYVLRAALSGGVLSWPTRPGAALQELHNAMLGELGGESFVTALFALVGVRRGRLQLATAGHPSPFVVRATNVERPFLLTAPAIGVDLEAALAPYPSETVALGPGDCVVFFTDGLSELRDAHGGFFEDALPGVLAGMHDHPAAEVVAHLFERAREFTSQVPADDIAVVCLRLKQHPEVEHRKEAADAEPKDNADERGTGVS